MKDILLQKTWPAHSIRRIEINMVYGSIKVAEHEGDHIRLDLMGEQFGQWFGTTGQKQRQWQEYSDLEVDESSSTLKVALKDRNVLRSIFRMGAVDLHLWLPARKGGYEVALYNNMGDIRVEHFLGELTLHTYTGDLALQHVRGEVHGRTLVGDINVYQCRGDIQLKTTAGNLKAAQCEGNLDFTVHGGNATAHQIKGKTYINSSAGNVKVSQLDGDVRLHAALGNIHAEGCEGNLRAQTSMGNIRASMGAVLGQVELKSASGNIKLDLPAVQDMALALYAERVKCPPFAGFKGVFERKQVVGTVGNGGPRIEANAGYGNVRLRSRTETPINSVERVFKEAPLTLPPFFFQPNWRGLLISLAFCILLTYGFSAILFFALEQWTNQKIQAVYTGIVLGYLINALFSLIWVNVFSHFTKNKKLKPAGQYTILIVGSLVLGVVAQIILGLTYWQFIELSESADDGVADRHPLWLYLLIPPAVSSLYYYFWQRSKQISRKISEQEYQLVSLEKMKTKAELDALQARINPHFLYNALNSIAGLVHEDAEKAEKMTLLLSKLFRFTIGTKDQHYNTIQHEIEIATTYLEIEQVRFCDRLSFQVEVAPELLEHEIPRFLLQPLVENAVKHGIAKLASPGFIHIAVRQSDGYIVCSVTDNGAPFPDNFFSGYGLQSIQDKLHLLYGTKARMDIQNDQPKQVVIYIPC